MNPAGAGGAPSPLLPVTLVFCLVLVSPAWIETDAYRYGALVLVAGGLTAYVLDENRQPIVPMTFVCLLWSAYVGLRYGFTLATKPDTLGGSAEGVYLLPALCPPLGLAFLYGRAVIAPLVWAFMLLSLVLLAMTVDFYGALSQDRTPFLFHNNTIHASVGGGFIVLAGICFALDAVTTKRAPQGRRLAAAAIAVAVVALGLVGVLGAQSKGVWIALAGSLPLLALMVLLHERSPRARGALAVLIGLAAVIVLVFLAQIRAAIGPSLASGFDLVGALFGSGPASAEVRALIASGTVPDNFNVRLMLWVNAIEIWSRNVAFGVGVHWEDLWRETSYARVGYELLHNGFLEIAMRYGVFGLMFYAALAGWAVKQAHDCLKRGLIGRYLYIFYIVSGAYFLLTIMTNSNNRLAIGESFLLVAAGFGFCCRFIKWKNDRCRHRSA